MEEFIFGIACLLLTGVFMWSLVEVKHEGAMEVYRGNTTLEYTIVDSVVVDSCVVFK